MPALLVKPFCVDVNVGISVVAAVSARGAAIPADVLVFLSRGLSVSKFGLTK